MDREGEIYIIETKLYKNPDKRAVVAQVLDYGASLWKYGQNFDDFIGRVEEKLNEAQHVSLNERLGEVYGLDEEETDSFRRSMRQHLSEGSFKFVVLMDALHEGLKDLIIFLNQNTRFSLFAVEVEYYKHDGYEIVIPKLFGAESPKSGVGSRAARRKLTKAGFLSVLGDNAGPEIAALAKHAIEEAPNHGLNVDFGVDGASLKFTETSSAASFTVGNIGIDGKLQYTGLFSQKCVALKIPRNIWQGYYDELVALIPGSKCAAWKKGELGWVADANDDWPSAESLLRNGKQWFKIINDTMDQIRPLLAKPGK